MLKKAFEVREKEGDEAMSQWFNSLSDEDKNKFLEELDRASETMHATFTNFREAVIDVFNKIFPHIENIVKALSEVLQNESGTTSLALDGGDSAPSQALSTPEVNPLDGADTTPPAAQ